MLYRTGRSPRTPRPWMDRALPEVTADATVAAGLDGEAIELDRTVHFTIRPTALRVRVPLRR